MAPLNCWNVSWCDTKWRVAEISMAAVTPPCSTPISHVRVKVSDLGAKYSSFWLIWTTSYPTWNTDEDWKSCMTAHPNNEATQKTPTQQNWTFVSQAFEHAITLPFSPQFSLYWEGWVQRGVCGSWAARAMWDKGTCWLNRLDFDCRSCVWRELRAEWR